MSKILKKIWLIPVMYIAVVTMIIFLSIFGGSSGGQNGLAASAVSPGKIQELQGLKPFGAPIDIIMMVTSHGCKNLEEADLSRFIFNAMEFLVVQEEEFEFVCICEPPEPTKEDPYPSFECSCDNWESAGVSEYKHKTQILRYLGITEDNEDISCMNLQSMLERRAEGKSGSTYKYSIKTIRSIPNMEYKDAIGRCGVTKAAEVDGIMELHLSGYFLEWLGQNGLDIEPGGSIPPPVFDKYMMPVAGNITSPYGMRKHPLTGKYHMHTGVDIGSAHHDYIRSVADGVVVRVGTDTYNGRYVLIAHLEEPVPFYSYYGHLSQIKVSPNQSVDMGETIGIEGGQPNVDPDVGYSTGHHLHFEIWLSSSPGSHTDPLRFLSQ